jgi:hypothetical protein
VGLYTDVICYHAFTAGRLNNRIHRRNRNASQSVTESGLLGPFVGRPHQVLAGLSGTGVDAGNG